MTSAALVGSGDELIPALSRRGRLPTGAVDDLNPAAPLRSQGTPGSGGASSANKQSKLNQLNKNKAQGNAFETLAKQKFQKTNVGVQTQVTIKAPSGTRTRVDLIGRDTKTGNITLGEAKSSQTAPLTRNQKKAFPEIAKSEGGSSWVR
ncbi:hypothetical protein DXZ20_04775 [Leptolyngbyaceae cyanobacterium CCMR0081]|uniref:Uncharacterized protein n=1 Tax=Adonisia turfae CCMR0081 TaxID=2292702 RepID=A0A6M0RGI4_9CYAN|nr:hypothetical protein [Adonisia turfae CCMR0081]